MRKGDRTHMSKRFKRLLALLLTALFLALPVPALADSHMNSACTIEIHAENPDLKALTDYTYTTTVCFKKGDWFTVSWEASRPVAALYWEWRYLPKRALVECLNDAGEVVSSREYGNKIRFLTVFPEEGVSTIRMTVLEGTGHMAELFAYDNKHGT